MIYFIHGTDFEKARAKAMDLVASLQKKKPDAAFFKMDREHFEPNLLQEYSGGQGLFENKYIVLLNRLCEVKEIKEILISFLKEIAASQNIFIILENKLDKATLGKIEKQAEKSQEFLETEIKPKETYSAFGVAEAFARKDKKTLWTLYRQAIDRGEAPEALHGMVFWKVKTMLLNQSFGVYSREQLEKFTHDLVTLYHNARRGEHELETALESFFLAL